MYTRFQCSERARIRESRIPFFDACNIIIFSAPLQSRLWAFYSSPPTTYASKNSPVPSAGKGKIPPPTARAQAAKPTSGQPLEPIREGRQVSSLSIAGVLDQRLFRKSLNPTYLQITCGKPPLFLFLRRKYCSVAVILHPPG